MKSGIVKLVVGFVLIALLFLSGSFAKVFGAGSAILVDGWGFMVFNRGYDCCNRL